MLDKIITEEINEYLDKNVMMPLKKYFDKYTYEPNMEYNSLGEKYWNGDYTEKQIEDLVDKFYQYYPSFLSEYFEEELADNLNDEEYDKFGREINNYDYLMDKYYLNDNFTMAKKLYKEMINKYGYEKEFKEYLINRMRYGDFNYQLPTWAMQQYQDINKKRDWLIHFSDHAKEIFNDGAFTNGNSLEDLSVTSDADSGDYAFAIPIDDYLFSVSNGYAGSYHSHKNSYDYGKEAIIFQVNGIKTWHRGDREYQVIFNKNEANNLIYLQSTDDGIWYITDLKTNRPIIKKKNLYDLIKWVMTNKEQYKNRIIK